jgi:hypothetical protein
MNYEHADLPAMTDGLCDSCGYDLAVDLNAMFFTTTDGQIKCVPCAELDIKFTVARGLEEIAEFLGVCS